ncbi:filamentous hemagglutinin N-terminal domain-containing protein [Candidatus Parabeggiatoa sp. HSG14]|uniref:two-partner secretion domain-containing protein n=1 Tax=Candidatus Parabeggiatoa sp. HSG14 TaxID=3055593 RepID=UPI0025A6F27D|nr:filamentous hemagglutinin N-terminal domain-containing protein [Thiotrichales bacterium HSG14]
MKRQRLLIIFLLFIPLSTLSQITTDGTLSSRANLQGPNYMIGADLGHQLGSNLFHSFQDFNLNSSESATFSGPNSVSNIISRVTGGTPSNIDGLIRSTIPHADMYFLNPNGIMFGPNAQLDVQGSFHASTADTLRFQDGKQFNAREPNQSLLSIAPISAFGFLTSSPTSISIDGSQLFVPTKKTLSVIGGQLTINQAELTAPFGQCNLISIAGFGDVIPKYDDFIVPSLRGNIITQDTQIITSGKGGGSIFIRGGQIFADNSAIEAKTLGHKDGGVIDIRANTISLTNGATLNGNTEGTGKGSNIYVKATESITIADGEHNDIPDNNKLQRSGIYARSGIDEELTDDNLGDASKIELKAKNIFLKDGAIISVSSYGGGKGGDITLKVSESVFVVGETNNNNGTAIATATYSEGDNGGDGGNLLIEAQNISVTNGAFITSNTYGKGKGGSITLKASDKVTFKGESSKGTKSQISLQTYYEEEGAGDAGTLLIEANNILFTDGGLIDSNTFGKSKGGSVTLKAFNTVTFEGESSSGTDSYVSLQTYYEEEGAGDAGTLLIEANSISFTNSAFISSSTIGKGNAGDIFVKAQDVLFKGGAFLLSNSFRFGKAGNIEIHATGTITIAGANKGGWGSSIGSNSNPMKKNIVGGPVGGPGGNILIKSKELIVKDGGNIMASSIAPKNTQSDKGGNITIRVQGAVEIEGVNPYGENEYGFGAGISAHSIGVEDNAGDAGTIMLQAGSLRIRDGGVIISSTNNNAQGGNIDIDVHGAVTITGDASNILLREPANYQLKYLQEFSPSTYNQSTSGIYASSKSKTDQAGQAGNITLSAQNLTLTHKGKISSSSAGSGKAGDITIEVAQLQLDGSSSIASESSLFNAYNFANLAERDSHILISGNIVEVTDIGDGKPGRYINTGKNLRRITPIYTVADMKELHNLTNQSSIAVGDIIEVKDAGNSESARFIYAYQRYYDLVEWVKFDDKVTVTFENITELKTGWLEAKDVPYPSGEVIQVNNVGNGKPAIFIYSSNIVHQPTGLRYGQAIRVTSFNVADTIALNKLNETLFIQEGDTANVIDANLRFVFNGQSWIEFNNTFMVADIATMNALTIAQIGTIAETESTQPSRFIYSGKEWLPINNSSTPYLTVSNLAELNKLSAKQEGDLVGVRDAGFGQFKHFFYANGEWIKQVRGGDAGQIVINADSIQLTDSSEINTGSISGGGGSITLNVDKLVFLNNSQISTSVQKGVGNGGDLSLNPEFVIMENGKIIAKANEGQGGNINITTTGIYTFPPESASTIDASSKLGVDGEVVIHSPDTDVSSKLLVLSTEMFNANAQMQEPCSSKVAEKTSTFIITSREGAPNSPDDLLSSGPYLSKLEQTKNMKSIKGKSTKRHPQITYRTDCKAALASIQSSSKKENRIIPEQLFLKNKRQELF